MANYKDKIIKRVWHSFKVELLIGVLLYGILYLSTYFYKGEEGVMSQLESMGSVFENGSLMIIAITFFLGLILLVVAKMIILKDKFLIRDTGVGLFDVGVNLMRLAGGALIGFNVLYFSISGWRSFLLIFGLYAFIALLNASLLNEFKKNLTSTPNREFK